ncbi:MAG TPA: CGNR zinc finger domain-containing protein [Pseudonocardiaceae bacterium]
MTEPSHAAETIRAFANTVDIEAGTDELGTPAAFGHWLASTGLADGLPTVLAAEHEDTLALRAVIRAALGADGTGRPESTSPVLVRFPVFITIGAGADRILAPPQDSSAVSSALTTLMIDWARLLLTGEVQRLKRCAEDSCGWVFWDTSKNHSRRWCSMRICGNRAKARRYAARHH